MYSLIGSMPNQYQTLLVLAGHRNHNRTFWGKKALLHTRLKTGYISFTRQQQHNAAPSAGFSRRLGGSSAVIVSRAPWNAVGFFTATAPPDVAVSSWSAASPGSRLSVPECSVSLSLSLSPSFSLYPTTAAATSHSSSRKMPG